MKYVIRKRCAQRITTFYRNVSKKYKHTYSLELMEKNVIDAYDAMFRIENSLLRREPVLSRWKEKGYLAVHQAVTFQYVIIWYGDRYALRVKSYELRVMS